MVVVDVGVGRVGGLLHGYSQLMLLPPARRPDPWILKLARAQSHIEDLEARVRTFLDSEPCDLQHVAVAGGLGLRLRVKTPPPPELAAIVGDAVHNLRSALDTSFVGCVEKAVGRDLTEAEARALALPTSASPTEFEQRAERLAARRDIDALVAARARTLALNVQSFAEPSGYWADRHGTAPGGEVEARTQQELGVALRRLARLSNTDKHRGVHFAWWGLDHLFAFTDGRDAAWRVAPGPWEDGDTVVILEPAEPDEAFAPLLQGKISITLPEAEAEDGIDLVGQLGHFYFWANRAVEILAFEVDRIANAPRAS